MKLKHKVTGEITIVPDNTREYLNAFIVPEIMYDKKDYELVEECSDSVFMPLNVG